jgi:phosphoenolpyruvate phosphomutase
MYAIILNSGKGSRLQELTTNKPKGLVDLTTESTILSRQIDILTSCGIEKLIITTGYLAEQFKQYISRYYSDLNIEFIHNDLYDTTNYIVSLNKLQNIDFSDSVLLIHGDLVFTQDVLAGILGQSGSCVVVDSTSPIPDKDFKARIGSDGHVKEIGVDVFGSDCVACQPLYKLELSDWQAWQKAIKNWCDAGKTTVYAEHALNSILGSMQLMAYDVKGRLCREVDTKEDLLTVQSCL